MPRARHEALWTHQESSVKGPARRNRPWILLLCAALVVGLAVLGYSRYMNFQTVSYELRECAQPLTVESSWQEVQDAACDPVEPRGSSLFVTLEGEQVEPAEVEGSTFRFEMVPLHSPAQGVRVELEQPAQSVVVVEPEHERARRQLNGDSSGTVWTGNIGSRGPLNYWVLVTP